MVIAFSARHSWKFIVFIVSCLHGRAVIRSSIEPVENSVVFIRLMVNWTFQSCQLVSVLTVSQTDRHNTATLDTPSIIIQVNLCSVSRFERR